jgi:hypothetical protein
MKCPVCKGEMPCPGTGPLHEKKKIEDAKKRYKKSNRPMRKIGTHGRPF